MTRPTLHDHWVVEVPRADGSGIDARIVVVLLRTRGPVGRRWVVRETRTTFGRLMDAESRREWTHLLLFTALGRARFLVARSRLVALEAGKLRRGAPG